MINIVTILNRLMLMPLWKKIVLGTLFMTDAELEIYFGFAILPKYFIEIVGPINILLILSTLFAGMSGAVMFSLGFVEGMRKLYKWLATK